MNKLESVAAYRIAHRARQIVRRKKQAEKDLPEYEHMLRVILHTEPELRILSRDS